MRVNTMKYYLKNIDQKLPLTFLLALSLIVSACGINPVTKKREFQFVCTKEEIGMAVQYMLDAI